MREAFAHPAEQRSPADGARVVVIRRGTAPGGTVIGRLFGRRWITLQIFGQRLFVVQQLARAVFVSSEGIGEDVVDLVSGNTMIDCLVADDLLSGGIVQLRQLPKQSRVPGRPEQKLLHDANGFNDIAVR